MKFWKIEYQVKKSESDVVYENKLAAPKIYLKKQVLQIIRKVHPEWKNIKLSRTKKPKGWKYGDS